MSESGVAGVDAITVDTENLYREESITDLRAATIRQLIPITEDGSEDPSRQRRFIGDTTLMTQMGPIPVQFPLEVETLAEAFEQFPEGVKDAIERLNDRAREMAREEASRIVVPGQGGGAGGAGMPGMPPGGKFGLE
ncbi:MAG: cytoplasmic protein [Gammaproteobacteria bacterium]